MTTPEGRVLKAVCDYLALQERLGRCVFWRQNNGATYDARKKCYRATTGSGFKYGVPDVIACLTQQGGRMACLECKSDTGKLSEHQIKIKAAVEAAGGVYVVVRGIQDVEPLFVPQSLVSQAATSKPSK